MLGLRLRDSIRMLVEVGVIAVVVLVAVLAMLLLLLLVVLLVLLMLRHDGGLVFYLLQGKRGPMVRRVLGDEVRVGM